MKTCTSPMKIEHVKIWYTSRAKFDLNTDNLTLNIQIFFYPKINVCIITIQLYIYNYTHIYMMCGVFLLLVSYLTGSFELLTARRASWIAAEYILSASLYLCCSSSSNATSSRYSSCRILCYEWEGGWGVRRKRRRVRNGGEWNKDLYLNRDQWGKQKI